MKNQNYYNYIDTLINLYKDDDILVSYMFSKYIENGITISGEYGNYLVYDCERGGYFDILKFETLNEVVYNVLDRVGIDLPIDSFYLIRDRFLEINRDLVEELLNNEKFKKQINIPKVENLNLYQETLSKIDVYLKGLVGEKEKKEFLTNIIYLS